jgi:hypothetical protein
MVALVCCFLDTADLRLNMGFGRESHKHFDEREMKALTLMRTAEGFRLGSGTGPLIDTSSIFAEAVSVSVSVSVLN